MCFGNIEAIHRNVTSLKPETLKAAKLIGNSLDPKHIGQVIKGLPKGEVAKLVELATIIADPAHMGGHEMAALLRELADDADHPVKHHARAH